MNSDKFLQNLRISRVTFLAEMLEELIPKMTPEIQGRVKHLVLDLKSTASDLSAVNGLVAR